MINDIAAVRSHDHLCLIYQDDAEMLAALVPFFRNGLDRGERCIYIGDSPPVAERFAALVRDGLVVMDTRDAYLRDGSFDLDRMLSLFRETVAGVRRDGRAMLRVAGEAAWMLTGAPGVERFFEYESRVNELFAELEIAAL